MKQDLSSEPILTKSTSQAITVRIPNELMITIDEYAKSKEVPRSIAIRWLLKAAIQITKIPGASTKNQQ